MSFAIVPPPKTGEIGFLAVTAVASAIKEIAEDALGYYTFVSDVDLWILFGEDNTVPDPDETETDDAEADLPWPLPANTPRDYRIAGDAPLRFFKVKGTAIGELRFYRSGS